LEKAVEPRFHLDAYGYRPGRSALDAARVCRKRCWEYNWVIDLDLRKFFNSVRAAPSDRGRRHALSAAHGERSLPPIRVSRWVGGGSRASQETLKPAMAAMSESPRNLRSWLAWPA
jgi:hypothetical protein